MKFKTSRTLLQTLFPTPAFKFASSDTVAFATFSLSTLGNLEWLGGKGYSHFGLYVHGVEYTRGNGDKVKGTFLPVLFENLADPIVSGREELGMPKVFCDLDVRRVADTWRVTAGWMGSDFLDLSLTGLGEDAARTTPENSIAADTEGRALLLYKYIPKVGNLGSKERGQADVEHAVIVPSADEAKAPRKVEKTMMAEKAQIKWDALDWKRLPTLHHIVDRLAEIPVFEVVEAKIEEGKGLSDVRGARKSV